MVSLSLPACAAGGEWDYSDSTSIGGNSMGDDPITVDGLNDLRSVVGGNWGYVFVAGDCVFTEGGYYRLADMAEYALKNSGVDVGEYPQKELADFARTDHFAACVYRLSRGGADGENSSFYAIYATYDSLSGLIVKDLGTHFGRSAEITNVSGAMISVRFGDGNERTVDFGAEPYVDEGIPIDAELVGGQIRARIRGAEYTITAEDIISGNSTDEPTVMEKIVAARKAAGQDVDPKIVAVKTDGGELFAVLEDEPQTFAGFRDVNDGVPPIIFRCDPVGGRMEFTFCGLVDFTGQSVYKIVKL